MNDDDVSVIGCMRVADMEQPRVASDMRHCEVCRMAVWLAHSSPQGKRIYCMPCALDAMRAAKNPVLEPPTAEQLADIRRRVQQ